MKNYKVLKMNKQQQLDLEKKGLEIEVGGIYREANVDSMCTEYFVDCDCEGACIDCLVKNGIVQRTSKKESEVE